MAKKDSDKKTTKSGKSSKKKFIIPSFSAAGNLLSDDGLWLATAGIP